MGKLLSPEDGEHLKNIHLGCISGVFPVLDYQNWHFNLQKILPQRKHAMADKHNSHTRSIKDRIKSLVSEETSKNGNKKRGRMLQRTYSIHHLETDEWVKKPDENDTNHEIEDYVDTSENSKINKNILQNGSQVTLTKPKLTTSSSFPSIKKLRPTKLKHKLNEFYSVPKIEKGFDNWAQNLDLSNLESLMIEFDEQDGKNSSIMSMKRTCSFNESSNRYSRLFDNCDFKETMLYNNSNVLHNDFYPLPIEEEGGQTTQDIKSNSSLQEESHQLEFQISEGLKPLSENTHNHNDDEYFNYVMNILEMSGFIKNGFEQTWYASKQPLNPSMFEEIESQYPYDPQCFEQELIESSYRLHWFELVNETLIKLYERSFSYYPKPLSNSCHLSPAPSGKFVLEEVWKSVSRLLNLKPDMDQSLESIVYWDLRVGDEWMNLQMEFECIALELEDMIFNEVLGEVLCS